MHDVQKNMFHPKHDHIQRVLRAGRDLEAVKDSLLQEDYEAAWDELRRMRFDKAEALVMAAKSGGL